ncbi:MAG: hypothetical protein GX265_02200 [Mollicutes bacterium]|nr:hypothetical protein [Mollicutes bacterium]
MANFLQFAEEDIQSKKTLLSTMPTTTKTNKRKYNEKIDSIKLKYEEYRIAIKKYLDVKSKSFNMVDTRNPSELTEKIADLEHIKFILNPTNTFFEKMGFDTLLYQMGTYQDLKFSSLKRIINDLLDKFDMAGAKLKKEDFNYTFYVYEFMSSFLDIKHSGNNNYDGLTEIFEKIYWENPELIKHMELNFRRLIRQNERKFINYVSKLQNDIKLHNGLDYEGCLEKLNVIYRELNTLTKENICDIIELSKNSVIDINQYFEDSKTRTTTFSDLMIDALDFEEEKVMNRFYDNIERLKSNVEEYANYVKFAPLINNFKNQYLKNIPENPGKGSPLKDIESKISKAESKLTKLNKKIINSHGLFFRLKEDDLKNIKFESIKIANELCKLYDEYIKEYFDSKVIPQISESFAVADLLHLYYSYDYYKKSAIKIAYDIDNYDEIVKYSDSFDLFAMNPTNVIVCSAALFDLANIARVIINKYRLLNININEEDLNEEDLSVFLDKLKMILRIKEIDSSSTSVEKIWFMTQVYKFNIADSNSSE